MKSLCEIHLRLVTISFSISGTIAYPPPMVKAPILKKIPNALNVYIHDIVISRFLAPAVVCLQWLRGLFLPCHTY